MPTKGRGKAKPRPRPKPKSAAKKPARKTSVQALMTRELGDEVSNRVTARMTELQERGATIEEMEQAVAAEVSAVVEGHVGTKSPAAIAIAVGNRSATSSAIRAATATAVRSRV